MQTEVKTALVTGASSGIGLATSRLLLDQGYQVIGISRRGEVAELGQNKFVGVSMDLADLTQTDHQLRDLLAEYRFDCFIHAAGHGLFGSIEQFSVAQIDTSIRTNLTSALVLSRALIPTFRRQGDVRLIFIGSESALGSGKKGGLYSAAKFGLRGFCQALREDCGSDGIQISLINPGMVRSPFFDDLSFQPGANSENAIESTDVANQIWQILQCSSDIVIDEVNMSPRVKSINFNHC